MNGLVRLKVTRRPRFISGTGIRLILMASCIKPAAITNNEHCYYSLTNDVTFDRIDSLLCLIARDFIVTRKMEAWEIERNRKKSRLVELEREQKLEN